MEDCDLITIQKGTISGYNCGSDENWWNRSCELEFHSLYSDICTELTIPICVPPRPIVFKDTYDGSLMCIPMNQI